MKCVKVCNNEIAEKVLSANTAADAKAAAKLLSESENEKWQEHKNEAMYKVLKIKADQCSPFLDALIDSGTGQIFEATNDCYWGIGLDMKFASNTHPNYYPGSNVLGNLLEKIRDDYITKDLRVVNECNVNDASSSVATSYDEASPHNSKKKRKIKARGRRSTKKRISYCSNFVSGNYTSIDKYLKQVEKKGKILKHLDLV